MKIPITRYYGSKRKLVEKIWNVFDELDLEFDTVLDLFGGSGIFSYYAKRKNKTVFYNDIFRFNYLIGKALVEATECTLSIEEVLKLLEPHKDINYKTIVADYYKDIYYTDIENQIIDIATQNIQILDEPKRTFAYYILFQSCLIKRPFNLFHRKNLSLRLNHKESNFGNKKTWEKSYEELFLKFSKELNDCVFDNGRNNRSVNFSALQCPLYADLIYIDPPYFRTSSESHVSYHSRYHFLEGLAYYEHIEANISDLKANKEILINTNREFEDKSTFVSNLTKLIEKYQNSIIAISYCSPGYPTIDELEAIMLLYKTHCHIANLGKYSYALNRNNEGKKEYLIVGY